MPGDRETCEYVLDPDDPETWRGESTQYCLVSNNKLNEDGVWTCPHDTIAGEDLCIFHQPVEEKDDEDVVESFLNLFTDKANSKNSDQEIELIGARFGTFDLSDSTAAFETDEVILAMTHTYFDGKFTCSNDISPVDFTGAVFDDGVEIVSADFGAGVDFSSTSFGAKSIFSGLTFNSFARFSEARFDEKCSFEYSQFADFTNFREVVFGGETTFHRVDFNLGADISRAIFRSQTVFSSTQFGDVTTCINSKFADDTTFSYAEFEDTANFSDSEFDQDISFKGSSFSEDPDFSGTELSDCDFEEVGLTGADFSEADLSGANLERAKLSNADLFGTDLSGARLYGVRIGSAAANTETTFDRKHGEYRCLYDPNSAYEYDPGEDEQVPQTRKAMNAYHVLEQLTRASTLPDEQSKFFIRRQDMRRAQLRQDEDFPRLRYWFAEAQNAVFRHGESFSRVIGWSIGTIVAFTLFFPIGGWLQTNSGENITYAAIADTPLLLWKTFYHSTLLFLTGGGPLSTTGTVGEMLTTVEALIAPILLALLVFVLGRRAAR